MSRAYKQALTLAKRWFGKHFKRHYVEPFEIAPEAMLICIGHVKYIRYTSPAQPGINMAHEFSRKPLPLLYVAGDGTQAFIVLPKPHRFTERGFVPE